MQSARKSLDPSSPEAPDTNKKSRTKRKSIAGSLLPNDTTPLTAKKSSTSLLEDVPSSPLANGSSLNLDSNSNLSTKQKKKKSVSTPTPVPQSPSLNGITSPPPTTTTKAKSSSLVLSSPQLSSMSSPSSPASMKKQKTVPSPKLQSMSASVPAMNLKAFSSRGVIVQRCRFLTWQPSAVTCLAFNATGSLVAVGRASGDIEIWNVSHGWFCERVLGGSADFPVRNVHWVADADEGERLLSTGEKGITEWDLLRLRHKTTSPSYGGAVHASCIREGKSDSLKPEDPTLALACEDGTIRLFSLADGVQYVRPLQKHEAKALSVNWVGDMIVSGGADGLIMVWECATWTQTTCISVEAAGKQPTSVWQVKIVARDMSIISGDSLGHVQIWESKFGTLLQSFAQHQADVFALALSNGGCTLYAAGVDTQMVTFNYVPYEATGQDKWVVLSTRRSHTHDILALAVFNPAGSRPSRSSSALTLSTPSQPTDSRSLVVNNSSSSSSSSSSSTPTASSNALISNETSTDLTTIELGVKEGMVDETANMGDSVLISGGLDCQLAVYSRNILEEPQKILPFRPVVSMSSPSSVPPPFSSNDNLVASSSSSATPLSPPVYLLVRNKMELQLWRTGSVSSGESPSVSSPQEYLLRINTGEKGRAWNLISSAISPDGQWIAASSPHSLKLYRYSLQANSVTYVEESKVLPPSSCLCFTADSNTLICGGLDQTVSTVNLQTYSVTSRLRLPTKDKTSDAGCVTHLSVTTDSRFLAVSDHLHMLSVFDLQQRKHHCTLPSLGQSTLTMGFQPGSISLVVVTAKNEVYVFDTSKNELTNWSRQNSLKIPRSLTQASDRVVAITFNPSESTHALLVAGSFLCSVDLTKAAPKPSASVVRVGEVKTETQNFHLIRRFSPILAAEFCPNGLVVVEAPWFKVMQGFPAAFKRQKYGT